MPPTEPPPSPPLPGHPHGPVARATDVVAPAMALLGARSLAGLAARSWTASAARVGGATDWTAVVMGSREQRRPYTRRFGSRDQPRPFHKQKRLSKRA